MKRETSVQAPPDWHLDSARIAAQHGKSQPYAFACAVFAASFGVAAPAFASEGLNLFPDPLLLLVNLVVVTALIYPINKLLLQPLAKILVERKQQTAGSHERAESLRAAAVEAEQRIEAGLRAARAEAQVARADLLAVAEAEERRIAEQAQSEAANTLGAVRGTVSQELASARADLRGHATQLAREAAARILGRSLVVLLCVALPTLARAAESGHGEGEHHIDWTTFIAAVLNFAILAAILIRVGRKPIQDFFLQRRESIQAALNEARTRLTAAEAENERLRARVAELANETRSLVQQARKQAESEIERIQQRAKATAERIREDSQRLAALEVARAKEELRNEAAALATTLAGDLLKEKLTPDDDRRLLNEFVARVEAGTQ